MPPLGLGRFGHSEGGRWGAVAINVAVGARHVVILAMKTLKRLELLEGVPLVHEDAHSIKIFSSQWVRVSLVRPRRAVIGEFSAACRRHSAILGALRIPSQRMSLHVCGFQLRNRRLRQNLISGNLPPGRHFCVPVR